MNAIAQIERNEAIARVERNAEEDFKTEAYSWLAALAEANAQINSDLFWKTYAGPMPHEPRALGAVVTRAAREGLIDKTGTFLQSDRPEAHMMDIRVWNSLIWKPDA